MLVGPSRYNPVLEPLAVKHLDNRLYMKHVKICICFFYRLYGWSILPLWNWFLHSTSWATATKRPLQSQPLRIQCSVCSSQRSTHLFLCQELRGGSQRLLQTRVYPQQWLPCQPSLHWPTLCRSLPWNMWNKCSVCCQQSQSNLLMSERTQWGSIFTMHTNRLVNVFYEFK